jgi:hypothetical protein
MGTDRLFGPASSVAPSHTHHRRDGPSATRQDFIRARPVYIAADGPNRLEFDSSPASMIGIVGKHRRQTSNSLPAPGLSPGIGP